MNDELFERLWQALIENGTSRKNHDATYRYWATLEPDQQEYVATVIPQKVQEGKFVQYDPIRAIKENIRLRKLSQPAEEPTNMNGRALKEGVRYVSALYNGQWGMYTEEDVKKFNLKTRKK